MAFEDDLRVFMENRLQAFDPTIDLGPNSPAQVQIIDPTISRFGTDPFSVDIPTFLRDRLVQEFPELAADEAGLLEDLFTEPLQLLLEPFKREVETTRINQSVQNASLLSDDEADALGANFFEDREEGDFAGGLVRLFFAAPTTARITTDRQVTSRQGFAYFPTENTFITSAQMIFNRDGTQFFVDISVRAAEAGDDFNIGPNEIVSIDDVEGVVRASNPVAFTTGQPRQTNEDYLDGIPQALTERSLVTKRGVTTRTPDLFGSEVRAIQVVGAGEEGMDRDILTGTGEGFVHLVGTCSFFGSMIFIGTINYKDDGPDNDVVLQVGDTVRLILDVASDPDRTVNAGVVSDFISVDVGLATEKHIIFLEEDLDTLIGSSGTGASVAIFKAGFITISGIPGGISTNVTVPDGEVHLGGHTDVLVRPSADSQQEGVIPNLTAGEPLLALLDIVTTLNDNLVSSGTNFVAAGVEVGDLLVIETGASAGSYRILSVGTPDADTELRVDAEFSVAESSLRARLIRTISVDLVEPKVPKVPFTEAPVSDLRTTVGSALFRLTTVDIQTFGAAVGDTIRVLTGANAGDYLIEAFDSVLGGQGPIVDRPAASTEADLQYQVFTASDGLVFPLVRIRTLEVLDSTNQGTGINVPYGDAVDVRTLCDLEGAGRSIRVLENQLIMFPDASVLWGSDGSLLPETFASTTSASADASYSKGLRTKDGRIRTATSGGGNPISIAEHNFPPFLFNGRRDAFLALTTEEDPDFTDSNTIPSAPGEHRTSPLAEAEIGDSLVILDGPNAGSFTIKDIRILDMWAKTTDGHRKIALIQVDQETSIDPVRTFIDYIADVGSEPPVTATELATFIEDATRFYDAAGFFESILIPRVRDSMIFQGFATVTTEQVRELIFGLATTGYEVGPSARGTFRLFFQEPVSAELFFGEDDPTTFQAVQNPALNYRLDPELPPAQILPEADEETSPLEWARDLGLRDEFPRLNAFHVDGSSFALQGILDGDIIEYHRAINDLLNRDQMESSWVCVTQAGSNVVRMIVPKANAEGLENEILPEAGHLFFIDSGPDIGAYVITEVFDTNDLTSTPPILRFKIDKSLSHSTEIFPSSLTDLDHASQAKSVVVTSGNVFPMTGLTGKTLSIDFGPFGPFTHTFTVDPADIDALVADLTGGAIEGGGKVEVTKDGTELVLRSTLSAYPDESIIIRAASTGIGSGFVEYTSGQFGGRHLGALALGGSKRLIADAFGSGWEVDQWLSLIVAGDGTPGADIIGDGVDQSYLGTFRVAAVGTISGGPRDGEPFIELDRSADFAADANVRWIRHAAPAQTPANTTGGGKELANTFVRCRMYKEVPEQRVLSIPWGTASVNPIDIDSEEQIKVTEDFVSGFAGFSHKMPYRIIRNGVKRISSTAMSTQRDGALYFLDVPVIGIGVLAELNITPAVGLTLEGRFNIAGYTLRVDDENFTYSVDEQVSLILPNSVLPVGSTPGLDNEINLAGQNLQVNYDNAPLIASIQQFYDSPLDRVVVANMLVRHFLPSYVFLDITYVGGDQESVVASELINHINNIDPDLNELVVDSLVEIVRQRNADQVRLPINVIALTHGTDRRVRGSQSEDVIGGQNIPTFRGTFNQTYFIAGPDTSAETTRPDGEQIFLVRV